MPTLGGGPTRAVSPLARPMLPKGIRLGKRQAHLRLFYHGRQVSERFPGMLRQRRPHFSSAGALGLKTGDMPWTVSGRVSECPSFSSLWIEANPSLPVRDPRLLPGSLSGARAAYSQAQRRCPRCASKIGGALVSLGACVLESRVAGLLPYPDGAPELCGTNSTPIVHPPFVPVAGPSYLPHLSSVSALTLPAAGRSLTSPSDTRTGCIPRRGPWRKGRSSSSATIGVTTRVTRPRSESGSRDREPGRSSQGLALSRRSRSAGEVQEPRAEGEVLAVLTG